MLAWGTAKATFLVCSWSASSSSQYHIATRPMSARRDLERSRISRPNWAEGTGSKVGSGRGFAVRRAAKGRSSMVAPGMVSCPGERRQKETFRRSGTQARGRLRRGPGNTPSRWRALRLAHHLDRLLQQLIAARDHTGEGAADRDGGLDSHSEVGRAVLLPDVHARPAQGVAAGHVERIHAAVGARGGPAHEGAEMLALDNPHQALGGAQDPAVDEEGEAAGEPGRHRRLEGVLRVPTPALTVGLGDDRDVEPVRGHRL